ncbi:MAG: phosphotransferase [Candidatus Marinimicrobia bacterium]|nr:phosphotransferase [Candidatus Neomarinimicrobiota bacterium]
MQKKRQLKKLYTSLYNEEVNSLQEMPRSGSYREYYRLTGTSGRTVVGVYNEDRKENIAFLSFCRHFRAHDLAVPEIYADDLDNHIYLQEDLGSTTLYAYLTDVYKNGIFPQGLIDIYKEILRELPKFQLIAGKTVNYSKCYPRFRFDRQSIMWDLNYFKYYFLKLARIPFDEQELENDFNHFTDFLLETECDYFLYRDFQSRNIMLKDGKPYFIDFQGGRHGALQYDVASLLYDAKADIPHHIREMLFDYYLDVLSEYHPVDRKAFTKYYHAYVLVRIMQAMGAYGFRGFYEKKQHFLKSVPYAIENIAYLLNTMDLPIEVPALTSVLERLTEAKKLMKFGRSDSNKLTVEINSFSYKKGIPDDTSGNGGGFVFDCRGIHNPGRYEEYKNLTGRDKLVKDFLTSQTDIESFLQHAIGMVETTVDNYVKRKFTHLIVSFGCTGGQHRSVYCADKMVSYLKKRDDIIVKLTHNEKDF